MRAIQLIPILAILLGTPACHEDDLSCSKGERSEDGTCVQEDSDPSQSADDASTDPELQEDAGKDAGDAEEPDAGDEGEPDAGDIDLIPDAGKVDGSVQCVPAPELCNGMDDNCDGQVDEGLLNACGGPCMGELPAVPGTACSNGLLGACFREGIYACDDPMTVSCNAPSVTPGTEICNGIDDDCDGQVDEGVTNACGGCEALPAAPGSNCTNGLLGACARGGQQMCAGLDKVICNAPQATGSLEVCGDNVDNDCDGATDEPDAIDHQEWYNDCDSDGYPGSSRAIPACSKPPATATCADWTQSAPTSSTLDCNDRSAAYRPNAPLGVLPAGFTDPDLNCDDNPLKEPALHFDDGTEWRLCTGSTDVNCGVWSGLPFGGQPACSAGTTDLRPALQKLCFLVQGTWSCSSTAKNALQYCN